MLVVLGKVLHKACFSSAFLSMKAAFYHPHVAMMRIVVCVTIQSISVGHCYIFAWCGHIFFEWNEDVLFFLLMKFYFYFFVLFLLFDTVIIVPTTPASSGLWIHKPPGMCVRFIHEAHLSETPPLLLRTDRISCCWQHELSELGQRRLLSLSQGKCVQQVGDC